MSLNSELLAHHIATLKRGAGAGKEVNQYLDEMRAIIKRRVLSFDEEKRTKERLTKLIEKLAKELNKPAGAYLEQLKKELKDFARYESEYQSETIGDYVKLDLTTPTVGQLWAAAKFEPLKLGTSPIDFEKLIDDWGSDEVSRLVMGVKSGFVQGLTTQQIIKEVIGDGGLIDISQRNAETVARTAMQHVATTARIETYKANDDIVDGYEWVSTLDGRTSDICRARDGNVYKFSDKAAPKPPAHYNCLSGDTVVATCGSVSNAYKRPYKGRMIKISTESGRSITITPNHPVMTSGGWVAAGDINLTSKLACCNDIGLIIENNKDCVVSEFSELFCALDVFSNPSLISNAPPSTKDFHGDISDGEVNVISVDSKAWSKVKSSLGKNIVNQSFPFGSFINSSLPAESRPVNPLIAKGLPPNSGVGGPSKVGDLLWSASCHPSKLLLASVADSPVLRLKNPDYRAATAIEAEVDSNSIGSNSFIVSGIDFSNLLISECNPLAYSDTSFGENSLDWIDSNAENLGDAINSNPVNGIEFDNVVCVDIIDFCGHVYNLENSNNWYLSNGIITHNCRSTITLKVSSEFDFLDEGATRASKDGQVDANLTYYDWLKQQPASFHDEVLGIEKGKIFRNAGLSAEEFRKITVDDLGRPLTIDEMAARDKRVAKYMRG